MLIQQVMKRTGASKLGQEVAKEATDVLVLVAKVTKGDQLPDSRIEVKVHLRKEVEELFQKMYEVIDSIPD
jgi:hypothetical protein